MTWLVNSQFRWNMQIKWNKSKSWKSQQGICKDSGNPDSGNDPKKENFKQFFRTNKEVKTNL